MTKHRANFKQNRDFELCQKCLECKPFCKKNAETAKRRKNKKYKTFDHLRIILVLSRLSFVKKPFATPNRCSFIGFYSTNIWLVTCILYRPLHVTYYMPYLGDGNFFTNDLFPCSEEAWERLNFQVCWRTRIVQCSVRFTANYSFKLPV